MKIILIILLTFVCLFIPFKTTHAEGEILFADNFNDGNLDGWVVENGNWFVNNGNLAGSKSGKNFGGRINNGLKDWGNYILETDFNVFQGIDMGIGFRYTQGGNAYELNIRAGTGIFDTPQIILRKAQDGMVSIIGSTRSFPLINNKWYHLKVEVNGETIKVWVDNSLIFDIKDTNTKVKKGGLTFSYWTGAIGVAFMRFDNVKVIKLASTPEPPEPFLDLPWDYTGDGLSFNEAAQAINSYFDHEYPLLSSGIGESPQVTGSIINYFGPPRIDKPYSAHDGYDYGKPGKVNMGDSVLAAADGEAIYMNSCGVCGNAILIDHKNGYQTRYYHLQKDGLVVNEVGKKVTVNSGQQIGKVGATGNVSPAGDAGAHIHFMVVEDKNKDGNFEDNLPDGVTDPFGWQSKEADPWPIFNFTYSGQQRTGNTSFYLWKKKLDNLDATLTSNGGTFKNERNTLVFPPGSVSLNSSLSIKSSSNIKAGNDLVSIGSTIIAEVTDSLGNLIKSFTNFFTLSISFDNFNLSRYKKDTIAIYSSEDGLSWNKEPTTIDWDQKVATTQVNHLSHFALMAERADTIAPETKAILHGLEGLEHWFRSEVSLTLEATDNEGGLGVDYTMVKTGEGDWEVYSKPLLFTEEGHYKVEFYSADNDENLEGIKQIEFDIDKTIPEGTIDTDKKYLWPPDGRMIDVVIYGDASDAHLYSKKINVEDEYDLVEPEILDFGETIQLEAKREGGDLDGRLYIIKLIVEDLAGNIKEAITNVIVGHDQRDNKHRQEATESAHPPLDVILNNEATPEAVEKILNQVQNDNHN